MSRGNAYVVVGDYGQGEIVDEEDLVGLLPTRFGGGGIRRPILPVRSAPGAASPAHAVSIAPSSPTGPLKVLPPSAFPSWWSNFAAPLVAAYDATNQFAQANMRAMSTNSFQQHILSIQQALTQAAQGMPSSYGMYGTATASINSAKSTLASLLQGPTQQQNAQEYIAMVAASLENVAAQIAQLIQYGGQYVAQQYRQQNVQSAGKTSFWSRLFGAHRAM